MELDLTSLRDPALRFGSDDAAYARAPARRFDTGDAAHRTFFSHGVFAVFAIGFGAYFGNLKETLNPGPHPAPENPHHGTAQDLAPGEVATEARGDEVDLVDLSSFWQRFIEQYDVMLPAVGSPGFTIQCSATTSVICSFPTKRPKRISDHPVAERRWQRRIPFSAGQDCKCKARFFVAK